MYDISYVICWPTVLFSAVLCFIMLIHKLESRPKSKIQPGQILAGRAVFYN